MSGCKHFPLHIADFAFGRVTIPPCPQCRVDELEARLAKIEKAANELLDSDVGNRLTTLMLLGELKAALTK